MRITVTDKLVWIPVHPREKARNIDRCLIRGNIDGKAVQRSSEREGNIVVSVAKEDDGNGLGRAFHRVFPQRGEGGIRDGLNANVNADHRRRNLIKRNAHL